MSDVLTPEFRVSFPSVFQSRKNDLNGKDEFSLVALFKKGQDLSALKKAAADAVEKKWGKKVPSSLRTPFRDQGERAKTDDDGNEFLPEGYDRGAIFISLKSTQRPGLVGPNLEEIIDSTEFYAGCYARAKIRAYAYDIKGNKGVAFGLVNIQKTRNGEPLTGRTKAQDDFSAIPQTESGASASDLF